MFIYDSEGVLSRIGPKAVIEVKTTLRGVSHLCYEHGLLFCLQKQNVLMLDPVTLQMQGKNVISLSQELIEFAYDHDSTVKEVSPVLSMNFVGTKLALVTTNGEVMLLEDKKLK